jgi:phage FluMu protein Com
LNLYVESIMPIRFTCPTCKKTLTAADDKAGVRVACPGCKQAIMVPTPGEGAAPTSSKAWWRDAVKEPVPQSASKPPPLPSGPPPLPSEGQQQVAMPPALPEKRRGIGAAAWLGISGGAVLLLVVLVAVPILIFFRADANGKAVPAAEIVAEYDKDQAAAEVKYRGKQLTFSGVVLTKISNPLIHELYVRGNTDLHSHSLICKFLSERTIASVKEGDTVTVKGLCSGQDEISKAMHVVQFGNCELSSTNGKAVASEAQGIGEPVVEQQRELRARAKITSSTFRARFNGIVPFAVEPCAS